MTLFSQKDSVLCVVLIKWYSKLHQPNVRNYEPHGRQSFPCIDLKWKPPALMFFAQPCLI